jgi:hypothetical protein
MIIQEKPPLIQAAGQRHAAASGLARAFASASIAFCCVRRLAENHAAHHFA